MSVVRTTVLLLATLLISACTTMTVSGPAPATPVGETPAGKATTAAASLPDLGTLQIAVVPLLDSAPFFVAADMGYFADQGLTVEVQSVRNMDEMLAPLSTGKVDATTATLSTGLLNAMNQKLDIRFVAGQSDPKAPTNKSVFLVVSKALADSGAVKGVADLKGRKIAINLRGSIVEYALAKGLQQAGITLKDVELVTIPGNEMLTAVKNGAVDAAALGSLNAQRMIAEGVAVPLLRNSDVIPTGDVPGGVLFGKRLLQPENREAAIRFLAAYLKAARLLNEGGWDKPEVLAILQKYTGMEPAMIARTPRLVYSTTGELNEAYLGDIQNFQIEQGYVEFTEPIPLAQMVSPSLVKEAVTRLDGQ